MDNLSQRLLARMLRARLRNSVPSHILDRLSDDQLVDQYHRHHNAKRQWLAKQTAASEERIAAKREATSVEVVR